MKIITKTLSIDELTEMAKAGFGDLVKAVVDIEREIIALDAELHSDLEAVLLEDGSQQRNLWGINFYPDIKGDDFLEFDSMINMRPSQGNMSRGVDSEAIRNKIKVIISQRILSCARNIKFSLLEPGLNYLLWSKWRISAAKSTGR